MALSAATRLSAPEPGGAVFVQRQTIRFSHCDPAGMVFFPQYLVLLNGLVEDWFTLELGIDYAQLIGTRLVGLPTVSLQCEFAAPSRMGEPVDFSLQVERLGGRSITLAVACHGSDGQLRMQLRQVLVSTGRADDARGDRAIDIPPDVRAAIVHWQSKRGQQP